MEASLPVFFDRFGILIWIGLIVDAVIQIRDGKTDLKRDWRVYAELALGVAGLLVDGGLVAGHDLGLFSIVG